MILVRSPRSVLSHSTIGSISSSDTEVPEELSATAQPCVRRFPRGLRHAPTSTLLVRRRDSLAGGLQWLRERAAAVSPPASAGRIPRD